MAISAGFVLGAIIGSMLDPIAIIVCGAVGAFANRAWISAVAGYGAYIPLALIGIFAAGIPISISYVLLKSTAGLILGLVGFGVGRLVRKRKTGA